MTGFLFALQFLTIIPVRIKHIDKKTISESLAYFPLVGLLLGLILIGANNLLSLYISEQFLVNIILIVLLIILTGGIHLDGLADTTDAILSRKNKEEMLGIMRDSHIGVMGVLSLICIILLKISFLSSVSTSLKTPALLLMCILSRWGLVLSIFLFPYARAEGKAKNFVENINFRIFSLSTIITLILVVLVWQWKGLIIFALITIGAYIISRFIKNKIGGMTGDTIGAISEIAEVSTLFSILIVGSLPLGSFTF